MWLARLGVLSLVVVLVARFVRASDLEMALRLVRRMGAPGVLVLVPLGAAMSLDARAWQLILRALGHDVRWRLMVKLRLAVESVVLAMPGGGLAGEAAKAALLRSWAGVPVSASAASQALLKACLIGAEAIYLALGAGALAVVMLSGGGPRSPAPAVLAATAALLATVISAVLFVVLRDAAAASRLLRLVERLPIARVRRWAEARRAAFAETDRATRAFFETPLPARLRIGAYFLVEWLIEGAEMLLILRLLGVPLGLPQILVLDGASSFVRGAAFVVPSGLGFQDVTQIALLEALGVPDAVGVGVALAIVKRTKEAFWTLTGVLLFAGKRAK